MNLVLTSDMKQKTPTPRCRYATVFKKCHTRFYHNYFLNYKYSEITQMSVLLISLLNWQDKFPFKFATHIADKKLIWLSAINSKNIQN